MPYPDYDPKVLQFMEASSKFTDGIDPYAPLPEDKVVNGVIFSVSGTTFPLEFFREATLNQIRRYLRLLERGERFCDGHIEGEFRDGKVVAALTRLAEIRNSNVNSSAKL
ncbi:MAG TPA: DUF6508 domain-containing protein [Fimbriimonadaceae bacterium]|nr:DUF6508 domain-containing protein [Fimbriimonadaceae bacterium]